MKLTIVGCSGSAPGPESGCSCYLVEHNGYRLLLDHGSGSCGPLMRYAAPESLDQVFISHRHADHYGDLISLAYHRGRAQAPPLKLIGPGDLPAAISWLTTEPDLYAFEPAVAGTTPAGPMSLRLARVEHGDLEAWAVRVDDWLCYTADTGPCEAIDELAGGCRVLLAAASGLDGEFPGGRHLTARAAGELAARSGTRLLVITHLRSWMDADAILAEAVRYAGCPVVRAIPGLAVAA